MRASIYYPSINPPDSWVKQSLLYWDTICTVVHADFESVLRPDLTWLLDQGLYEPLFADSLSDRDVDELRTELDAYIESADRNGIELCFNRNTRKEEFLYYGKIPAALEHELERRALIGRHADKLSVSLSLLDLVICLLAKYLSRRVGSSDRYYSVYAAETRFAHCGFAPLPGIASETCLQLILNDLIPVPRATVGFEDILRFRETHRAKLLDLRRTLDTIHAAVASENAPAPDFVLMREELESAIAAVRYEMRKARIPVVMLSVSVLLAAGAATLGASHDWIHANVPWLFSGIGSTAALSIVSKNVRSSRMHGAFSYLEMASRQLA